MTTALLGVILFLVVMVAIGLLDLRRKLMADTSKLTASVTKLTTDIDAFLAAQANDQPAIDAAQQAVDAADAKVVAATPPTA